MSNTNDFVIENGVLTEYKGSGRDVIIPEGVTSIGKEAFAGCSGLTSVAIPEGVTSIGDDAFAGCSGLTSVTIPEGVTNIGEGAFYNCSGLTSVTIPEGVTRIGESAFRWCESLQSITLPEDVTRIAYKAFCKCKKLRKVVVLGKPEFVKNCLEDSDSLLLTVKQPITQIKSIQLKRRAVMGWLLREPDDPIVDKAVIQSIRNYWNKSFDAFIDDIQNDNRLLPALIENEMLSIDQSDRLITLFEGNAEATAALLTYKRSRFSLDDLDKHEEKKIEKAFRGPTVAELKKIWAIKEQDDGTLELVTYKGTDTEIIVPERIGKKTVTAIGEECFGIASRYGDSFRSVPNNDVREKITSVTISDSVTSIGDAAFYKCSRLTSVIIPEGVTSIGDWAFRDCSGLTSVTIPDSVTSIGRETFYDCTGLTSVTIPGSVTSIGNLAFSGCRKLNSISVDRANTIYDSRDNCNAIIETKTNKLIFGCQNTAIPESVTSIGGSAFWGCSGLTSVTIPEGVTSISNCAFYDCSGLTSVTIPESVTSIGIRAFSGCKGLADENGFVIINGVLFDYYGSGEDVIIPEGVTSIGDAAFYKCSRLTSVIIPEGVTSIGDAAFRDCSGLTSVTIPESVQSIGYCAFDECDNLTIHAPAVSYVEQYAKDNNIPFVAE